MLKNPIFLIAYDVFKEGRIALFVTTPKECHLCMKLPVNNAAFFFELETSLHMKHIRNSPDAVSALLADDFVEFGRSGKVWDKCSIIESMQREKLDQQVTVKDFAARELAPGVVLVMYKTASALRSSIWKRFGGKWQMIFHQGTRTSE